jgi:pimeloyl-ACP methyl ester carboxylesterase
VNSYACLRRSSAGRVAVVPAFLVHGNPDSHHMWEPLRAELGREDVLAVDLPGFGGTPLPDGFDCSKEAYADWLGAAIEEVGEPVDMVGHDWGALLCARVASTRPELARTLAIGGGPIDPDYTWHEMAQQWQTPGVGEELMAAWTPDLMTPFLESEGFPGPLAATEASFINDTMKDALLRWYRSAVEVGREWSPALDGFDRPALVLHGVDDPYVGTDIGERMARRLGGRFVAFENCGHWWPVARAADTAAELRRLWESAG